MQNKTPNSSQTAPYTPSGKSPSWLAFALVSSSYFLVLGGAIALSLLLP